MQRCLNLLWRRVRRRLEDALLLLHLLVDAEHGLLDRNESLLLCDLFHCQDSAVSASLARKSVQPAVVNEEAAQDLLFLGLVVDDFEEVADGFESEYFCLLLLSLVLGLPSCESMTLTFGCAALNVPSWCPLARLFSNGRSTDLAHGLQRRQV